MFNLYNHLTDCHSLFIQGVSQLAEITAGGDSQGLCDQKSSYKYVPNFG